MQEKEKKLIDKLILRSQEPYRKERDFFHDILFHVLSGVYSGDLDFTTQRKNKGGKTTMKCSRTYNECILISLVIQKRLYNSKKKGDLSNKDLIKIRGLSLACKFDEYEKIYTILAKKYPNLKTPPRDFSLPLLVKYKFEEQYMKKLDGEHFGKLLDKYLAGNDFSTYIKPFTFDYYKRCINYILDQYEKNELQKETSLIIELGIHTFLHDIKIDKTLLNHVWSKGVYIGDDSFEAVFHSKDVGESYAGTWNRFLEHYPKEIEKKFWEVIGKKSKK